MENLLRITLVRSPIGYPKKQREVLRSLGLKKINSSVIKADHPVYQGMIKHVSHLVTVAPVEQKEGAEKGETP